MSAARDWVSVNSTSFFVIYALFTTLMRDILTFSFLLSSSASTMWLFTVLNSPNI